MFRTTGGVLECLERTLIGCHTNPHNVGHFQSFNWSIDDFSPNAARVIETRHFRSASKVHTTRSLPSRRISHILTYLRLALELQTYRKLDTGN